MKQQNGLQNGHAHTNGHANGNAEHTLDIGVQLCCHPHETLVPDALFQRADVAAEGQIGMPCFVIRHEASGADVPLAGDALPLIWL